uniref:Variant surface glycoprotein 1125.294 n=1 Tax=Trypanosoma brucei TaxID=5691 RepID=A0A1J0R492_9TRYP|nr:variant surface glycoprotein 1125.294 [Trypanosoma brucei]
MREVQIMLVLFALHNRPRSQAAQAQSDKASGSVNSPCTEARYHHQLARKLQNALDSALAELSKYAKLPTAYRIAAANTASAERRVAFNALAINSERIATQAVTELERSRKAYTRALTLLSARVARLRQYHALTPTTVTQKGTLRNSAKPLLGATGLTTCEADVQLTAANDGNCSLESTALGQVTADNIDLKAATQIKMLAESKIKFREYKLKAGSKGAVASVDTPSTGTHGFCAQSSQENNPSGASNVLAVQLTLKPPDTAPEEIHYFENNNEGDCKRVAADDSYREDSPETLAAALCAVKKTSFPATTEKHKIGATSLSSDGEILTLLSEINSPGSKEPKTEEQKKALIHKFLSQDPATFKTEITYAVEKTEISITIREKPIKGTPIALAGTADGAEVLAYYLGKDLGERTQEKASANKPTVAKEQSDRCTAITDKEKCKTTDGCDFKNDKCVAKVEETGTEETQNTTGSSSIVIHKAPLFLAVLLLKLSL